MAKCWLTRLAWSETYPEGIVERSEWYFKFKAYRSWPLKVTSYTECNDLFHSINAYKYGKTLRRTSKLVLFPTPYCTPFTRQWRPSPSCHSLSSLHVPSSQLMPAPSSHVMLQSHVNPPPPPLPHTSWQCPPSLPTHSSLSGFVLDVLWPYCSSQQGFPWQITWPTWWFPRDSHPWQ